MMTTATIKLLMILDDGNFEKVIAAEGEHKASRALRHAAEVIADSPAALQVTRRIMVVVMVVVMVVLTTWVTISSCPQLRFS